MVVQTTASKVRRRQRNFGQYLCAAGCESRDLRLIMTPVSAFGDGESSSAGTSQEGGIQSALLVYQSQGESDDVQTRSIFIGNAARGGFGIRRKPPRRLHHDLQREQDLLGRGQHQRRIRQ